MKRVAAALVLTAACVVGQARGEDILIGSSSVPLFSGADEVRRGVGTGESSRVTIYKVQEKLDKVVAFYEQFFKENGYKVAGGKKETTYNVSVEKEKNMFALNIFTVGDDTYIQFVW